MASPPTSATATGRCTAPCWRSPGWVWPRGSGRSKCDGALPHRGHDPLAQLVCRQCVPGAEHLARTDGVEEGERRLFDAALPGHRHPVAPPAHGRLALVVDDLGEV